MTSTPVLIVGAGPVGLALAGDLGWRGVPCTLIEKTDGTIEQPRMDIVGPRTMEFCRRWGIADWVRDAPYPGDHPQDCIYVTGLDGYELGREPFPGRAFEKCPPQSPQKRERVPQDMFDPILQRFVRTFPHVSLRYSTELISFEESRDGVVATVRDNLTGAVRTISSDYLVGTDGGASMVRERLGITMRGNPTLTHSTNVMLRIPDFAALHRFAPGYRFIFVGPEGTWLTIVAINGRDRYRMSIVGSTDKVWPFGRRHPRGTATRHRTRVRRTRYSPSCHGCAANWSPTPSAPGAYFLPANSAHMMSPTGGFGMNTGIQDAVDLGWKLEACLQGWGGGRTAALLRDRAAAGGRCATSARQVRIWCACCRRASVCRRPRCSNRGRRATPHAKTTAPGSPRR